MFALDRAVKTPAKIETLLARWCAAFNGCEERPRFARVDNGKEGHAVWDVSFGRMTLNISLRMVGLVGKLDQNRHGALGITIDGRTLLLRQWYVRRGPDDHAWLSADEARDISGSAPLYFPMNTEKDQSGKLVVSQSRPFMLVADLSADATPDSIQEQTRKALDWHLTALAHRCAEA